MERLINAKSIIHELNNSHFPGAPYVDAGISIAIGKICEADTVEAIPIDWIENKINELKKATDAFSIMIAAIYQSMIDDWKDNIE